MAKRTCSIEGCGRAYEARGWCGRHWQRWRRLGSPTAGGPERIFGDDEARFWSKVEVDHPLGCWEWTAFRDPGGYGKFYIQESMVLAHRQAFELLMGRIPEGLQLDHLCRVRHCVNPDHLEAVTQRENILRGQSIHAHNARKTHCPRGHPYTEENTRKRVSGSRDCKRCHRDRERRRYHEENG